MYTLTDEDLLRAFKEEIWDKASEIDPDGRMDWEDLALGFFLGIGVSLEQASNYELLNQAATGNFPF